MNFIRRLSGSCPSLSHFSTSMTPPTRICQQVALSIATPAFPAFLYITRAVSLLVGVDAAAQAPNVTGPLAQQNLRSYRRYAALQQVLSLGHAVVSVEPEVLLLSDPQALLQQHPTDVALMSTAWGDEHSAYGEHGPGGQGSKLASQGLIWRCIQACSYCCCNNNCCCCTLGQHSHQNAWGAGHVDERNSQLHSITWLNKLLPSHPLGRWPYIICHHPTPTQSYSSSHV